MRTHSFTHANDVKIMHRRITLNKSFLTQVWRGRAGSNPKTLCQRGKDVFLKQHIVKFWGNNFLLDDNQQTSIFLLYLMIFCLNHWSGTLCGFAIFINHRKTCVLHFIVCIGPEKTPMGSGQLSIHLHFLLHNCCFQLLNGYHRFR